LDGIRGIAALMVVFYHYLLSYYPGLFVATPGYSHTSSNIESILGITPVNIIYNSGFAVCMFFVLSGFVLSHKYFTTHKSENPFSLAIKRYFRLVIPILVSVLISLAILSLNGYSMIQEVVKYTNCSFWLAHLWNVHPSLLQALKEAFFSSIFKGGTKPYNDVLWTMHPEFLGSLLVFTMLALVGKLRLRYPIYLALILIFYSGYMPAFIIGLGICDYYASKKRAPMPLPLLILFLLIILYTGSYQILPRNDIWLPLDPLTKVNKIFPFLIASILVLVIAINSERFQKILSHKWLAFLGKISFSLYLLHLLVLGSFSCYLFRLFYIQFEMDYFSSFLCMMVISLALAMIVSYLMYKYVDRNAVRFSSYLSKKLFKPS